MSTSRTTSRLTRARRTLAATSTGLLGLAVPLVPATAQLAAAHGAPVMAAAATATCNGQRATIVGTERADHLAGTTQRDVIVGLGGDDVITGAGGDDLICAGGGDDRVWGGAGDDLIRGGDGSDTLHGATGDDRLLGGDDRHGLDRGGSIQWGDLLDGGWGDDLLDPGVDPASAGTDQILRAETISYAGASRAVRVDLRSATGTVPGSATGLGHDTIVWTTDLEVDGSAHDDVLLGSAGRDTLVGNGGDDRIEGGAGADVLEGDDESAHPAAGADVVLGGDGDDELRSAAGRDTLDGGPGIDALTARGHLPVHMAGGDGADYLLVDYGGGLASFPGSSVDGGAGRDVVDLEAGPAGAVPGSFAIDAARGTFTHTVDGATATAGLGRTEHLIVDFSAPFTYAGTGASEQVDLLDGGRIHATMGAGNDVVYGNDLSDWVDGGPGTDTVYGGAGDDTCLATEHRHSCHG